jgi:hypothetical protein
MAQGKRRKKAQLNTPTMEDSEAPTSTSFFKEQSDSSSTTRGWSSSSERSSSSPQSDSSIESDRSQTSRAESERSSFYELSTTTPESCEDESSQESAPLGEIDTQPVGPASIRAQRAYPWRRYVKRQVQDTTEEKREFLRFQEKQTQIQRLRALNLHLPFSVYTEGQGLDDEDLEHVVNHVKGIGNTPNHPLESKECQL